jgi:hypothetical protein
VPNAGAVLLLRAAEAVGLDTALAQALEPWRRPMARHDPGKILLDLAVSLAVGGDCLADLAQLRAAPEVFGPVASDPMVSRLIDRLAADARGDGGDRLGAGDRAGQGLVAGRRPRP